MPIYALFRVLCLMSIIPVLVPWVVTFVVTVVFFDLTMVKLMLHLVSTRTLPGRRLFACLLITDALVYQKAKLLEWRLVRVLENRYFLLGL